MKVTINGKEYVPAPRDPPPCLQTFPAYLGMARKLAGHTLDSASAATGLSKSFLWNMEHGRGEPSLRTASVLAKTYNISLETLARSLP